MKTTLLLIVAFLTLSFSSMAEAKSPTKPVILHQHSNLEGVRIIRIRNTGKTGWMYIECENVISVDPIRVPHGTHTINLTTNRDYYIVSPPPCVVHRWVEGENAP